MERSAAGVLLRLLAAALLASIGLRADAQAPSTAIEALVEGAQGLLAPAQAAEPLPAPAAEPEYRLPLAAPADRPLAVVDPQGLISLSVRDASLRQVLSAVAETQNLNLIVAAPADVPVTADFKKMPLRDVLAALLHSTGHTWTERDGVLVVTSIAAGGDLAPDLQGRRVAVIELDFASAADLQPIIDGLLSSVGQSHFVETNPTDNRRTKELLVVEDLEPYLQRIEAYVAEADQAPRQVLIEINLLQVDLSDEQRTGVDFNALSRVSGARLNFGTSGLAAPFDPEGTASGMFVASTGGDLTAVIEALIATTDAKSLASPRLLCVNGQESRLQVGEDIGYTTTTTVNTTTTGNVQFLTTGTILSVTPRITRDGQVLLQVAPEVSTGSINSETNAPDKSTINVRTNVLLASGQGMIIGGLIQEKDSTTINRLPFLGSLPYINPLFQRRQVEKKRSELIVALVPHVLPLSPELECRNQAELFRASERLTYGPLCSNPRPYEPSLYDPTRDEKRLHLLDRRDPYCAATEAAGVCPPPEPGLRRLPPADAAGPDPETNQR